MAVVDRVYEFSFIVEDGKKRKAPISIPLGVVGDELTLEEMEDTAIALELLIDPVIRGDLKKAVVTIELERFTSNTGDPDSDVEEGAMYALVAQGTDKRKLVRFPTWDEAYILDGTDKVDHTPTQVQGIDGFFINGITVNSKSVRATDSEGRVIEAYYWAEEDFRRRKKARRG